MNIIGVSLTLVNTYLISEPYFDRLAIYRKLIRVLKARRIDSKAFLLTCGEQVSN